MKLYLHISSILLLFIISSCQKDPAIPEVGCREFEFKNCLWGPSGMLAMPAYGLPTYNPLNQDEIVYDRQLDYNQHQLVKYNFATGEETMLTNQVWAISDLSWSVTGWIAFASRSWKIWKIKDNGQGLTRLSSTPQDLAPDFHPMGDKLIYSRDMQYGQLDKNPDLRYEYKMMIIDLEGTPIDSFCRPFKDDPCSPWNFCSWSPDGNSIVGTYGPDSGGSIYGLGMYDTQGNMKESLYEAADLSSGTYSIGDVEWHPDGSTIFFTGGLGLGSVDTLTKQIHIIRKTCDNRSYRNLTISPDGKYLICERTVSSENKKRCEVSSVRKLVRMKIDGSEEQVLELP